MLKKLISAILILALFSLSFRSDRPAYRLFNAKGKAVAFNKLIKAAKQADVVLFGELHNNPICHWLQLELSEELYRIKQNQLVLGAEMFETDNQLLLDEYLIETIQEKNFESEARLWRNYTTDYKPLLQFARNHQLPFIATNVPRRYAALVHKKGFEGLETLSPEAKKLFPALPIPFPADLPSYKKMQSMMGSHGTPNLAKAQALKDATMAYFIAKNRKAGQLFIHFNGTYHSDHYEGIGWYLKQNHPDWKIVTIASTEQEHLDSLKKVNKNRADFILVVPETMTKTY